MNLYSPTLGNPERTSRTETAELLAVLRRAQLPPLPGEGLKQAREIAKCQTCSDAPAADVVTA